MPRVIEALKKHPVMIILGSLIAAIAGVLTILDMTDRVTPAISYAIDPYRTQKEAVGSLVLEQNVELVNANLGPPDETKDLCSTSYICPEDVTGELLISIYRDEHYEVRAVFEESSLKVFMTTLVSGSFHPDAEWLGYDFGPLGEFTYAQVYESIDVDVDPTALFLFQGPQSSAYLEVLAAGAPGNYQGLILGAAPGGLGRLPWDAEGAKALLDAQLNEAAWPELLRAATGYRNASVPDTFGLFTDDGSHLAKLMHDPQTAISILYAGTRL